MVGAARAKEMIITCDRYTAEDLCAWGMINRVVAPAQLLETARQFAARLLAKPARAVTGSKLAVNTIAAVAARELNTVHPELFMHSQEA
jgi:enoyl-CoA hydratase/carnithine racemase